MSDRAVDRASLEAKESIGKWTSRDTGWMLNLFGTAIGAGVLYLPIKAGAGGIWPLVVLGFLVGPMVWLPHRNLVRFCLSSVDPKANITVTVREHFGEGTGHILTLAYCLSVYPILLMYGIGMTNVVISYVENQLHLEPPSRLWLSLILVVMLVVLMHTGEKWMLRAVKMMVYPLVVTLLCISAYLIPHWNLSVFHQELSFRGLVTTLFFTTPLLIFSFNHSPACSALAQSYRQLMGSPEQCRRKTQQILTRNTMLLLAVILFFVFSCVLCLTPAELELAARYNLPVLSVLSDKTGAGFFAYGTPLIGFLALVSSFFGVYLGALEGIQGLVTQQWLKHCPERPMRPMMVRKLAILFIVLTCWGAGCANWSVIGLIEAFVVPVLATILYIMPVYAYYRVERLQKYRNYWIDGFTVVVGIVAICGFLVDKLT
ncbi:MAG: aromatic amino acid transport family protein [Candidatus Endonucleobacter bathymodioli]|uniref:Aromatic amino acid transport family protein n=1 Tax=Candidatus Endonucleibacter bathymodioli TaxID=539814 RepID=A0AA90NM03_9GAMM|nr:aromatic amino acid transport family protein [Candidatus Endonucleobacter bathymodioli]